MHGAGGGGVFASGGDALRHLYGGGSADHAGGEGGGEGQAGRSGPDPRDARREVPGSRGGADREGQHRDGGEGGHTALAYRVAGRLRLHTGTLHARQPAVSGCTLPSPCGAGAVGARWSRPVVGRLARSWERARPSGCGPGRTGLMAGWAWSGVRGMRGGVRGVQVSDAGPGEGPARGGAQPGEGLTRGGDPPVEGLACGSGGMGGGLSPFGLLFPFGSGWVRQGCFPGLSGVPSPAWSARGSTGSLLPGCCPPGSSGCRSCAVPPLCEQCPFL
ncbi:hypothetical protein STXM2123_3320 [Streptomyces sp. F-3]|nr:hypothetical protein STXM2123_3320 [Streptomyces sp. F-3]